jgi:hypothetical protein
MASETDKMIAEMREYRKALEISNAELRKQNQQLIDNVQQLIKPKPMTREQRFQQEREQLIEAVNSAKTSSECLAAYNDLNQWELQQISRGVIKPTWMRKHLAVMGKYTSAESCMMAVNGCALKETRHVGDEVDKKLPAITGTHLHPREIMEAAEGPVIPGIGRDIEIERAIVNTRTQGRYPEWQSNE